MSTSTTPPATAKSAKPQTRWPVTFGVAIGAAAVVALVLLAFLWPTVTSSVKDLPLAVAGNAQATQSIEAQLNKTGAFKISDVSDRAEAVKQVEERKAYGAVVVSDTGIEVVTASAASPVVSQLMNQVSASISQGMAQQAAAVQQEKIKAALATGKIEAVTQAMAPAATPKVTVTDVAPLNPKDSRGTGLALLGLPLAMGGMIGGLGISLVITGFRRRLAAATAYGVAGGLGLVGIMQGWFGILSGNYFMNALALGLGLFAIAMTIVGLESAIGRAGIPIGAVLTMFIGNPISSLTSPMEFLPGAWGQIGQWFVPGATGTLLRDLSYFPNAPLASHWLVLIAWSVVGILLAVLGRHRNDSGVNIPGTLDESDAGSSSSAATETSTLDHAGKHLAPETASAH